MQLIFKVQNQIITRVDSEKAVQGSENYLKAKFKFTSDWDGALKIVYFSNVDKTKVISVELDDNNECYVPKVMLLDDTILKVALVGLNNNIKITTTTATIDLRKYGVYIDNVEDNPDSDYSVLTQAFIDTSLETNDDKLILTMIRKNKEVVTQEVELPENVYIKSGEYDETTKSFIFTYSDGNVMSVYYDPNLDNYYTKEEVDAKEASNYQDLNNKITSTNEALSEKASKDYVDSQLSSLEQEIDNKQDNLESGTNIKTINGNSILGEGNIVIESGKTVDAYTKEEVDEILTKYAKLASGTGQDFTGSTWFENLVVRNSATFQSAVSMIASNITITDSNGIRYNIETYIKNLATSVLTSAEESEF